MNLVVYFTGLAEWRVQLQNLLHLETRLMAVTSYAGGVAKLFHAKS